MPENTMSHITMDYYHVFRIFEPYKFLSESKKLNKVHLIAKNKLHISQTEINEKIVYTEEFNKTILPIYKSELNDTEKQVLEIFLSNQLEISAILQTKYHEYTSEFYGHRIHSFLLHPIKYYREKGKIEVNFINVQLKIFDHGIAILIFSINEQKDININDFVKAGNDLSIQNAYIPALLLNIEKGNSNKDKNIDENLFKYRRLGQCKSIKVAIERYSQIIQTCLKDSHCGNYFVPYESMYITSLTNMPGDFEEEVEDSFKNIIVQLMESVPSDLYKRDIILNKYANYKYNKYRDSEFYANQYRSIGLIGRSLTNRLVEKERSDIEEFEKHQSEYILSTIFEEGELLHAMNIVANESFADNVTDKSMYLTLLISLKSNIFFILEFILMHRLSVIDHNQNFNLLFISESKLLDIETVRFKDWRNENALINSIYQTTLELFYWLLERTKDVEKEYILKQNRQHIKLLSDQRRQVTREKLNIMLSILSFLFSLFFSLEPISVVMQSFGIGETNKITLVYFIFNLLILLILILIFWKELWSAFNESKIGYWIKQKVLQLIFELKTNFWKNN